MDENSLGYLRNTYICEFNSQLSLCFLHNDKNARNKLQEENFPESIGNF